MLVITEALSFDWDVQKCCLNLQSLKIKTYRRPTTLQRCVFNLGYLSTLSHQLEKTVHHRELYIWLWWDSDGVCWTLKAVMNQKKS